MFAEIEKKYINPDADSPFPMVICNVGMAKEQSAINRPNGFVYHHWIWATEGQMLFRVGGEEMLLNAGEGVLCRKNVPHAYEAVEAHLRTRWVTFLGAEGTLDYFGIGPYRRFAMTETTIAAEDELDAHCSGNSTIISRAAAGYTWLTEWLEQETAAQTDLCAQIRRYLEAHYAEPLTLDTVAQAMHMSRYTLCHFIAGRQSATVMQQLKKIRIAKAKQFLRYTTCSVAEIGQMCGFENASYFGKQFRETAGCSPGAYRARHAE